MFGVTKKVSFSVVVVLTIGWGAFFLLFMTSSRTLLRAETLPLDARQSLPAGVRFSFVTDKNVYRAGDVVLLSLRNDSSTAIWMPALTGSCQQWWNVERLSNDGETWQPVETRAAACQPDQQPLERFPSHTVKTGEWTALVLRDPASDVFIAPLSGSYRIVAPYLRGKQATVRDWAEASRTVSTPAITIQ
ncbi:MAG: hypothetical protein HY975_00685 [Candidatus Kerfeldbacteria bacterium]|nr:hypothetical protein [Candidatus Kerfeldbacteria bacterium]